jgi:endo-1,4-beta-xylanase
MIVFWMRQRRPSIEQDSWTLTMKIGWFLIAACLVLPASNPAEGAMNGQGSPADRTLRELADQIGFKIGAAIAPMIFNQQPEYGQVLGREFNAAESVTIFKLLEPDRSRFNFREMDRETAFAREHHLTLFGGPLIYKPSTLPPWMDRISWTPNDLDEITRNHIQTVIRHGGDAFSAWEVVNEPLTTPNPPWGRVWSREEYIARAFRYAREASPKAVLLLNQAFGRDGIDRALADQFFELVRQVKAKGVAVDAAGIEMHLEMQLLRPTYLEEFRDFLSRADQAGLQVYLTEMDVYQGPPGAFPDPFQRQKQVYHDVLATCLASPACKAVFIWGISDNHNMYQNRPVDPRPDAKPLPFDDRYQKKPAYYGMLEALEERVAKAK